ncbi:MAG: DNA replication/repair protein RecF [Anaerolineae bacterium]|nr:DNA replication/repair protein RecF [Anaerolineae bacterium]MDW8099445.1 DNA replication/repair protein RecF [Anaerolineae bacterium]
MHHLSLTNFRNYIRLELDFPARWTLLQGGNAQGKSNLLEAIYYLATGRALQAEAERELVNWLALEDPLPYARAAADITHAHQSQRLEITLMPANGPGRLLNFRKQVRINGVIRRALDLVGNLRVVLFVPQDIELIAGPPAHRRRYLDVALCQMSRAYCRALASYNQVLAQRNALLRAFQERGAASMRGSDQEQLQFWNEQLIEHGTLLMRERQRFVANLDIEARARHRELTNGREYLQLYYVPSFDPAGRPLPNAQLPLALAPNGIEPASFPPPAEVAEAFADHLRALYQREFATGVTLVGPHRDDLRFMVANRDLRIYGSRGQQRTAALALKLAEVQVMAQETGEPPILLLDDVMSELDATRRQMVLRTLNDVAQAIITTTDWEDFTPSFRAQAHLLRVSNGKIEEVSPSEI